MKKTKSMLVLSAALLCGVTCNAHADEFLSSESNPPLVHVSAPPLTVPPLVTPRLEIPPINCPELFIPHLETPPLRPVEDDRRWEEERRREEHRWDIDHRRDGDFRDEHRDERREEHREERRDDHIWHREMESANAAKPNPPARTPAPMQDHSGSNFNPAGTHIVTVAARK